MNLVGLSPALYAAAVAVASAVSALIGAFAPFIVKIPGFRPADQTRAIAVRTLVGVLNLVGVIGAAFVSNTVIPKEAVPMLVLVAFGGTVLGHYFYQGTSNNLPADQSAAIDSAVNAEITAAGANAAKSPA